MKLIGSNAGNENGEGAKLSETKQITSWDAVAYLIERILFLLVF